MSDFLLFRAVLRDALRPRRLTISIILVLLAPVIGLFWHLLAPSDAPDKIYDALVPSLIFSFTLAILSVVNGTGVVSQEMEQRTIVYLLTRAMPRWRILLARFAGSLVVVITVTVLSTLLLALVVFGPMHLGEAGLGLDIRALLIGALVYGCVFLLVGAAAPRPLIYGLLFVFGWETWVKFLPGAFAYTSLMSYLRILSSRETTDTTGPTDSSGGGNIFLAFGAPPPMEISPGLAWLILCAVSAVALAAAIAVFSKRAYVPRDDAE